MTAHGVLKSEKLHNAKFDAQRSHSRQATHVEWGLGTASKTSVEEMPIQMAAS